MADGPFKDGRIISTRGEQLYAVGYYVMQVHMAMPGAKHEAMVAEVMRRSKGRLNQADVSDALHMLTGALEKVDRSTSAKENG